jgi:hypothetical protein
MRKFTVVGWDRGSRGSRGTGEGVEERRGGGSERLGGTCRFGLNPESPFFVNSVGSDENVKSR